MAILTIYIYNGECVLPESYSSINLLLNNIKTDNSLFNKKDFVSKQIKDFSILDNISLQESIIIIPDCDPYELQISIDADIKKNIRSYLENKGRIMLFGMSTGFVGEVYIFNNKKQNYKNLLDIIPFTTNSPLGDIQEYGKDIILDNGKKISYTNEPIFIQFNKSCSYIGGKFKVVATYNRGPIVIRNNSIFLSCVRIDKNEHYEDWKIELCKYIFKLL